MAKIIKFTFKSIVYIFALIGFVLVAGFFAVKYGFTNVEGEIDQNSAQYESFNQSIKAAPKTGVSDLAQKEIAEKQLICRLDVLANYAPKNAGIILDTYQSTYDKVLVNKMIFAARLRLNNVQYQKEDEECKTEKYYNNATLSKTKDKVDLGAKNIYPWAETEDWGVVKAAIDKDKATILEVSDKIQIDPRLVLSACIVEQLRLYNTQREVYEKVFKPLQILGSANKMAMGVMSIKEKTAIDMENNLKNPDSVYYLGKDYEEVLNFTTTDQTKERFDRLTSEKDHTYSYLYGGIYLKQIMAGWKKSGFPIDDRPEILVTLFNLGFERSKPKGNPEVGGSIIEVGDQKYTFGSLAYEFYYSGEMADAFPLK